MLEWLVGWFEASKVDPDRLMCTYQPCSIEEGDRLKAMSSIHLDGFGVDMQHTE